MTTTATTRDYQRSRVYGAEEIFNEIMDRALESPQIEIGGSTIVLPPEAKFSSPEAVQGYVDRVLAHSGVIENFWPAAIRVRKRKGAHKAHYQRWNAVIAVPDSKWALRESVVLHELAHAFNRELFGAPSHGPGFTRTYLTLLGLVMGPEAELVMRILYAENGCE